MAKRNAKWNYLLRGMIRCSCGTAMMVGTRNANRTAYYRCNWWHIHRFERFEHSSKHVRCDLLDTIVWDYILDLTTNPETFRDLLLEAQAQELDALQPKRERLTAVEGLISQAETDAAKFARALVDASGGVVSDMLKRQIDNVNVRHAALCAERDTLTAEIEAGALTDEQITAMLATFNQDVITGLQNATFEDKRRALEDLRVRVYVDEGCNQARVTCKRPLADRVIALGPSEWL